MPSIHAAAHYLENDRVPGLETILQMNVLSVETSLGAGLTLRCKGIMTMRSLLDASLYTWLRLLSRNVLRLH